MNSYSNEAQLSREPAKGQQKTKEIQDYACTDWDVSQSRSGMNIDLHLYDSRIGSRTGLKVSVQNESPVQTQYKMASLLFCGHVNTVLLNAELQEGE